MEHELIVFFLKMGLVALAIVVVLACLMRLQARTITKQPLPPELPAARTVRKR